MSRDGKVMSFYRANKIECNSALDIWLYSDTQESVKDNHLTKACGCCGAQRTPEGHDMCLGTLPGLMNACCGHGVASDCYVQFLDGFSVHGEDARIIIDILQKGVANEKETKGI